MAKNIEYETISTSIVIGDTLDQTFSVTLNGVAFDMTGKQIDMSVSKIGETKSWSSAGTSPAITISTSTINIYDASWSPTAGYYEGWLRNTTDDYVMAKVVIVAEK